MDGWTQIIPNSGYSSTQEQQQQQHQFSIDVALVVLVESVFSLSVEQAKLGKVGRVSPSLSISPSILSFFHSFFQYLQSMSCNSTIHPYNDIVRNIHRQLEAYNQQHPPPPDHVSNHDDHVPFEQNVVPTPPPPPTSSSSTTSTTTTTTVNIPPSMQLQPCMQRAIITHSISDALFLPIQLLVPTPPPPTRPTTTTNTDRNNRHSNGSSSSSSSGSNSNSNDGTDGPTPDSILWEIHPTGARNHHHHHHHHQAELQRGGVVVVQSSSGRRGRDVLARHVGSVGTIGWIVRRPGCSFCQQQALTLSILTSICSQYFSIPVPSPPDLLANNNNNNNITTASEAPLREHVPMFQIFGIVKDIYDTDSIIDYQRIYFPFPIYIDPSYALYQALGDRKLSLRHILTSQQAWKSMVCQTYQSLLLFRKNAILRTNTTATTTANSTLPERKSSSSSPHARINRRKLPNEAMTTTTASVATGSNDNSNRSSSHNDHATVAVDIGTTTTTTKSNNVSSDGIVQGGIIFFNARGTPVAMYPEETGQDLRIADIVQTMHAMIQQQEQQKAGG
jgi:hypothetical protein